MVDEGSRQLPLMLELTAAFLKGDEHSIDHETYLCEGGNFALCLSTTDMAPARLSGTVPSILDISFESI